MYWTLEIKATLPFPTAVSINNETLRGYLDPANWVRTKQLYHDSYSDTGT